MYSFAFLKLQDVEYYSQSVNAWYQTSLEKDKAIFVFSMAGIGFLATLLTAGLIQDYCSFGLLIAAVLSFLISSVLIIHIFGLNKEYLVNMIADKDNAHMRLGTKDSVAMIFFFLGIVITIVLAIRIALPNIA